MFFCKLFDGSNDSLLVKNPMFRYRVQKITPLDPILSLLNRFHNFTIHVYTININLVNPFLSMSRNNYVKERRLITKAKKDTGKLKKNNLKIILVQNYFSKTYYLIFYTFKSEV
jgi:hypothetical protein